MYNMYQYEKSKQEEKTKLLNQKKEDLIKEKKKNLINQLVNNYNNRLHNFVFDMATKQDPIVIKDYMYPVKNNREILLQEEEDKILGNHGLVFSKYINAKERIKKLEEDKIESELYLSMNKSKKLHTEGSEISTIENTQNDSKKHMHRLSQPRLHYKPRSDLERIIETINSDVYHKIDKKLLFKLNENEKKVKEAREAKELREKESQLTLDTNPNEKYDTPNYSENGDLILNIKRKHPPIKYMKRNLNSEAKYILNEFHVKSHFKGTAALTLKTVKTESKKEQNENYNNLRRNKNIVFQPGILSDPKDKLDEQLIKEHEKLFKEDEINQKIEELNYCNPFKAKKKLDTETSQELLDKIKDIYIENELKEDDLENRFDYENIKIKTRLSKLMDLENEREIVENKRKFANLDDGVVEINNKIINRKRVDIVASQVLKRCNYFHNKSKSNAGSIINNESGKLMFSYGMTVKEFKQKYNVK